MIAPAVLARLLQATPDQIHLELDALPEEVLRYHPGPGEWCAKEVLGHLAEEDPRDFGGRIRAMLTENDPSLAVSDQEALARARHDCDRGLTDLLNEFQHRRAESLVLVKSLKPDDLMRAGHHPAIGRITVHELLHEWAYHDRNHLQQIHSNVRAWLWPFIGNTQRFYGASTA